MNALDGLRVPPSLAAIQADSHALQFDMAGEVLVGMLLRSLAASKSNAVLLELGTGTGLSTAWLLEGMDRGSRLLTVDYDAALLDVARRHLGQDPRLSIICEDGETFVTRMGADGRRFDLIFADTWAGKYLQLEETLEMLRPNGMYVIDDMLPQQNWPAGHADKAATLVDKLRSRTDLFVSTLAWSCGVIVCTKTAD